MPRLRVQSGKDLIKIFEQHGFIIVGQKGSHVKLRRITAEGTRQTLTIPNHDMLDKGTVKEIYRQALPYVSENLLRPSFYSA